MVTKVARECVQRIYRDHESFFKQQKVSKYFGNRRYLKGEKPGKRKDGKVLTPIRPELRKRGFDPDLENQMTSISCVDLARMCLKEGFHSANLEDFWKRIDDFNKLNGNMGTILQVGLQALGWKIVYWNPDPRQNAKWDTEDRNRSANNSSHVWGYHAYLYATVMKSNKYYEYTVDDKKSMVGFGTHVPAVLSSLPFFVGTAHMGYHVFLGVRDQVLEAHSTRSLFSLDNIEVNPFNPLAGLGPKSTASEVYRSGILAVPPDGSFSEVK